MNKDIDEILAASGGTVLATVTRTEGSSYRRCGARMLAGPRGRIAGSVSGGCIERDLVRRGAWLCANGPRLLRLATSAEADEEELHYLGCGGTIEVLVESIDARADDPLELLRWIRGSKGSGVLATVTRASAAEIPVATRVAMSATEVRLGRCGQPLLTVCQEDMEQTLAAESSSYHTYRLGGGEIEVFIEYVAPVHELLIAGRHHDVTPLVELARMLGWQVTVAAGSGAEVGQPMAIIDLSSDAVADWVSERTRSAVVVMTHSMALDRQLLAVLLGRDLAYLGLLGPRHRAEELLAELAQNGELPPGAAERLHAPIGLDLGGDGPEAIALAIAADIQATWSNRDAGRSTLSEPAPAKRLVGA